MKSTFRTSLLIPFLLTLVMCSKKFEPSTTGLQGGIVKALKDEPARSAHTAIRTVAQATPATDASAAPSQAASSSAPAVNAKTLPKIEIHAESIKGVTTWVVKPKTIKSGKSYLLVAKDDLKTGPAFHGLTIKDFGIATQVNLGKEFTAVVDVPADKKGPVEINCQFHPKHAHATLMVE
jgi:hypothetical protein